MLLWKGMITNISMKLSSMNTDIITVMDITTTSMRILKIESTAMFMFMKKLSIHIIIILICTMFIHINSLF